MVAAFFLLEAVPNLVAFGAILGPQAYLRNVLNLADFLVVVLNVLEVLPHAHIFGQVSSIP